MESFSLLKYWRTGGTATDVFSPDSVAATAKGNTKTIVTAAVSPECSDGEDGPYFDLEFALPEEESDGDEEESEKSEVNDGKAPETEEEDESESESDGEEISVHGNDEDEEGEIDFSLGSNECSDQNVAVSPSNELFFKGDLVSIEPSSILLNSSEENSKLPVFLVKSATKFRVLLLKLKKSKSSNGENVDERENQGKIGGKSISVKFKVEEVPLVNLFTRESSSKENNNGRDSEDRKVMHKYLKMVKPFYIRVSKRYVDKLKFSGHLSFPGGGGGASKGCAALPPEKAGEAPAKPPPKQGTNNLQAGLRVVRKHLGKSRSASAAVSAALPAKTTTERRDDSLLQVQDGIQGAILHCKRSFNASREMESSSSILCRSVSDPSYEKSVMMGEAKK